MEEIPGMLGRFLCGRRLDDALVLMRSNVRFRCWIRGGLGTRCRDGIVRSEGYLCISTERYLVYIRSSSFTIASIHLIVLFSTLTAFFPAPSVLHSAVSPLIGVV